MGACAGPGRRGATCGFSDTKTENWPKVCILYTPKALVLRFRVGKLAEVTQFSWRSWITRWRAPPTASRLSLNCGQNLAALDLGLEKTILE
jgi:hypothetical protein